MRYFLDTEFIEDGYTIDLISIGIVAEDDTYYYAQNASAKFQLAGDFVSRSVLPQLTHFDMGTRTRNCKPKGEYVKYSSVMCSFDCPWRDKAALRQDILMFIPNAPKPEFWGYYADYDWVVFCQIFGTMLDLPRYFPYYCRDIKQLCDSLGNPKLPSEGKDEHHALADAQWNRTAYNFLVPG